MQAKLLLAAVAAFLSTSGIPGNAAAVETLSCDVMPISNKGHLPSEISIQMLADQRLAAVNNSWIETAYGQPVLASLKRKSQASFVLRWEVEHPGDLGGPAPTTVHFRAILNIQNLKITVLASEAGGSRAQQRGTGSCASADN